MGSDDKTNVGANFWFQHFWNDVVAVFVTYANVVVVVEQSGWLGFYGHRRFIDFDFKGLQTFELIDAGDRDVDRGQCNWIRCDFINENCIQCKLFG